MVGVQNVRWGETCTYIHVEYDGHRASREKGKSRAHSRKCINSKVRLWYCFNSAPFLVVRKINKYYYDHSVHYWTLNIISQQYILLYISQNVQHEINSAIILLAIGRSDGNIITICQDRVRYASSSSSAAAAASSAAFRAASSSSFCWRMRSSSSRARASALAFIATFS